MLMSFWLCLGVCFSQILAFTPFYSSDFCSQTISNDCNTTFSYIDEINDEIFPILQDLVHTSYFKYFKINFDKQCKFWNEGHFCATENCAVEILPPSQYNWDSVVLNELKPSKLGDLNKQDEVQTDSCEDLDYCELDDDNSCDYINLVDNPERFTGYGGNQAHNIWKAIYEENCFKDDEDAQCSTKKLFQRILSGMHASISTHLSNEYILPDVEDIGDVRPNLKIFMERVGEYNDRVSNLYFNYGLISQAVIKLFANYPVVEFVRQSEDLMENQDDYYKLFTNILEVLKRDTIFDSSLIIEPELKNDFRSKFKNISSIMDCVGCDRCRMWGKLQTIGYGTALKVLFEDIDDNNLRFKRIELVSLINTFDRLSKSIEAVKNFKLMYLEHLEDVEKGLVQPGDFDKVTDKNGFNFPFLADSNSLKNKISQQAAKKPAPTGSETKDDQPEKSKFRKDLDQSWKEVIGALQFLFKAYKHFPAIVYKQTVIKLNYWWNKFIGLDTNEYYEEIQLQKSYLDLFHE